MWVIASLEEEMASALCEHEYEQANRIRDQLVELKSQFEVGARKRS